MRNRWPPGERSSCSLRATRAFFPFFFMLNVPILCHAVLAYMSIYRPPAPRDMPSPTPFAWCESALNINVLQQCAELVMWARPPASNSAHPLRRSPHSCSPRAGRNVARGPPLEEAH